MSNFSTKRILVVLGTRPEAIKLAPLILALRQNNTFEVTVCATGQHREMLRSALETFAIVPDADLELMTQNQSLTILAARAAEGIDKILKAKKYDGMVVQGDTTTCAAAAMAAFYAKVPLFHVEAGLRSASMDSPYPEEFNRRLVTLAARGHFCPTPEARANLEREGVDPKSILVTGNTGIDALFQTLEKTTGAEPPISGLKSNNYILATLHRRENLGPALREIFTDLKKLSATQEKPVVLPLHLNPNVRREAEAVFGKTSGWLGGLLLCDPVDYSSFVRLMNHARLIITDSGGIQEECTALGKSMLICRDRTERPEALTQENVRLIPPGEGKLYQAAMELLDANLPLKPSNVFGRGDASKKIVLGMTAYFAAGAVNA